MTIKIQKCYGTLNAYDVEGDYGTIMQRTGCRHNCRFDGHPVLDNKYTVIGNIGEKFVYVRCVDYVSARALFNAMEQQ